MLERAEAKDSPTEATSVPVEMISDNLREKLLYLESRGNLPLGEGNIDFSWIVL